MDPVVRRCDPGSDLEAVKRIWEECGWIEPGNERQAGAFGHVLEYGEALVGVIGDDAECFVHRTPGSVRYDETDLSLCAVTAVTTSAIARNAGLASALTAQLIADGAAEGAAVSALGMFEQGFYNRFGLGTASYDHQITFDPSALRVERPTRAPVRLTRDDWADVHGAMLRRARAHGSVCLDPPGVMRAELGFIDDTFVGLGFRDAAGRLTQVLAGTRKGEYGPLKIDWLAYEDGDQLLELLGLVRSLGAQLQEVTLDLEPPGIQLQDLIDRPIRDIDSIDERRQARHRSAAWWQLRILDLEACTAARSWPGEPIDFDLTLSDPLSERQHAWPGLAGEHTITVGEKSEAKRGHRGGLPVLGASVSAFSRLWFGVRPATGLAITDDLHGPPELLAALDRALLLPPLRPGWSF